MSYIPAFPKNEYDLRYKRARELMIKENLDALLITDPCNYVYFGGHSVSPFQIPRCRPNILIFPRETEPVIIAQVPYEETLKRTSWIGRRNVWTDLPFSIDTINETLIDLDLADGRIGAELGGEVRLGISYEDFTTLKKSLPKAEFLDASRIFWGLRMIKSKAEIDCLRKACEITGKAHQKLVETLRRGMTEKEIAKSLTRYMIEDGSGPVFVNVKIEPGAVLAGPHTDRALKDERYLWIDSGASYKGYQVDFSMFVFVGRPTEKQKRMYSILTKIMWKCIEKVGPGINGSDIAEFAAVICRKAGLSEKKIYGRLGHGYGLGGLEPPSIMTANDVILKPGMAITIEPAEVTPYGYFQREEDLVVTSEGYELLSTGAKEIWTI